MASSTENTEEERSLRSLRYSPSLLSQESAGVVGTDMAGMWILGTLCCTLVLGKLPYIASRLNLVSLGRAAAREGMVRVEGRSGPSLLPLLQLSLRCDCLGEGHLGLLLGWGQLDWGMTRKGTDTSSHITRRAGHWTRREGRGDRVGRSIRL